MLINLNVDQFFGIEIEEFPAQIAQVALWLMDHQMNMLVSEEFGQYFARIPLETSATIVCGNALKIDWEEVVPARHVSYIMGNPPFDICSVPPMLSGNQPVDGGNYFFTPQEREEFVKKEPQSVHYFKKWLGAEEFINGIERWFLLLSNCEPSN